MSVRLPTATISINAELVPAAASEPNIAKSLDLAISLKPDLSGMNIAYCITLTAATLASGSALYNLNLQSGAVSGVTGSATVVRSAKDAFGNTLPTNQARIGLILIETGTDNADPIVIAASNADATLQEVQFWPDAWVLANQEIATSNLLGITFANVGDSVKVTVFSTNSI